MERRLLHYLAALPRRDRLWREAPHRRRYRAGWNVEAPWGSALPSSIRVYCVLGNVIRRLPRQRNVIESSVREMSSPSSLPP